MKSGSPPPMRGKGSGSVPSYAFARITPAYAGKSFHRLSGLFSVRDHPRLCGEKDELDDGAKTATGSPPPMRGKGFQSGEGQFLIGITPAYAGKSHYWIPESKLEKDHPRLCGEKLHTLDLIFSLRGSPPPMRGKVHFHSDMVSRYRITPAYAGKSDSHLQFPHRHRDHPRLCGEKYLPQRRKKNQLGSPPPMRGKAESTATKFQ